MDVINKRKLLVLFATFSSVAIFWNDSWIQPFKIIVVFFHEISHAMGAILTGGTVESIRIFWDESGYTVTKGGNFLVIASAGYLGCTIWGSSMLLVSLSGKLCNYFSIASGLVTAYFILNFSPKAENLIYFLIIGWCMFFVVTGVLFKWVSRYSLFYMGGITSLYSLFDLFDFFRGQIQNTDAGKIASYYVSDPFTAKIMAYAIGGLISLISVLILYKIIVKAAISKTSESVDETPAANESPQPEIASAEIDPELLKQIQTLKEIQRTW